MVGRAELAVTYSLLSVDDFFAVYGCNDAFNFIFPAKSGFSMVGIALVIKAPYQQQTNGVKS